MANPIVELIGVLLLAFVLAELLWISNQMKTVQGLLVVFTLVFGLGWWFDLLLGIYLGGAIGTMLLRTGQERKFKGRRITSNIKLFLLVGLIWPLYILIVTGIRQYGWFREDEIVEYFDD